MLCWAPLMFVEFDVETKIGSYFYDVLVKVNR